MAVVKLHEEVTRPLAFTPLPPEPVLDDATRIAAIGVLTGLAHILAARLILLLSVLGAFALTFMAVWHPSVGAITASGIFDALVVIPMGALALRKG